MKVPATRKPTINLCKIQGTEVSNPFSEKNELMSMRRDSNGRRALMHPSSTKVSIEPKYFGRTTNNIEDFDI